ncbi:DUF3885 domain-containing protein [Streptomyces mutomycini]|uniref:DUF3885 domain-containing protein n=1 Tax=Streptomyces mutomycini TaxID=284036 RepID=UPI003B8A7CF7
MPVSFGCWEALPPGINSTVGIVRMPDHGAMSETSPRQGLGLDALSALWEQRSPALPEGLQMRHVHPDRWVRFHSLPGAKRYPESDGEYAIMLDRHHTVLNELGPTSCMGSPGNEPGTPNPARACPNCGRPTRMPGTGAAMSTTMISRITSSTTNTSASAPGPGRRLTRC